VRAKHDYFATSAKEFSFEAGDVIAVTATPDDGWWCGVHVGSALRIPGKTRFPSKFIVLF
ncbi:hypothetical protein DFH11DRAFT_1514188, partial [Phellopilus nigrolimitatus]